MRLSGQQCNRIADVLLDSFSASELRNVVRMGLNEELDHIAGRGNMRDTVDELIQWALRTDRLTELIAAAALQNPTSKDLQALKHDMDGWIRATISLPASCNPSRFQPTENGASTAVKILVAIVTVFAVLLFGYWLMFYDTAPTNPVVVEYAGRIVDAETLDPVERAEVSLELEGAPPVVYSDSEGIFRFAIMSGKPKISGRVRVTANGYQPIERYIELDSSVAKFEDIRLVK